MIAFFSKHRKSIFVGTVAVFLGGIFVGLGGYLFSGASTSGAVASIGNRKIPYSRFQLNVRNAMERMSSEADSTGLYDKIKGEILRDMLSEEIFAQEAEKMGISVSDFEVSAEIQSNPQFQQDGAFSHGLYFQAIRQKFHMMPEEFEAWRKHSRLSMKMRQLLWSAVKFSPSEIQENYIAMTGSLKDFDKADKDGVKGKDKFMQNLSQQTFVQSANYFLRQATANKEIKTFLEQREKGL